MAPEQFGSFQVREKISSGHLTDVYRAVQLPLGRDVALKTLRTSISHSQSLAQTISQEAKILAKLRHENIPRIVDFHIEDEQAWFVQEFVDGFSVAQILARTTPIPPVAAATIVYEVASALQHAHDCQVVHSDVQPSNIMISRTGQVVVVDFGSSELLDQLERIAPIAEGVLQPLYMSPEMILGDRPTPQSDIFLLGVLLYEMLTGVHPFSQSDERALAHSIRHEDPKPMPPMTSSTGRALGAIVEKCLSKDAASRYPSMDAVRHAVQQACPTILTHSLSSTLVGLLGRAGLVSLQRTSEEMSIRPTTTELPAQPSLRPMLKTIAFSSLVLIAAASLIQLGFRSRIAEERVHPSGPLALVPNQSGSLRVTAEPWAHVYVDGQLVETTPFAKPIPLSPGVHHVVLEHPQAATERRVLRIRPNESVALDVSMKVHAVAKPAPSALPKPADSTP